MIQTVAGFHERERGQVARMYWRAFGGKLGRVLGPEPKALAFLERVLDPEHGIAARNPDGDLLGVLGFKTYEGALVGGDLSDLRAVYGWWGGLWRAGILEQLEHDSEDARFLLDGVFVAEAARGQGVGTALLAAAEDLARTRGFREIRLDVIDSNGRARALYERLGFAPRGMHHLGLLRWVFRFRSAETMVKRLV